MDMDELAPDERTLREHLESAAFAEGVARCKWRLLGDIEWPHALIVVRAAARQGAPREFVLRFDLAGYPVKAPAATLWDTASGGVLPAAARPKGGRAEHIFRVVWPGGEGLYAPYDRIALNGHPDWKHRYRDAWHSGRTLAWELQILWELLNGDDYVGVGA